MKFRFHLFIFLIILLSSCTQIENCNCDTSHNQFNDSILSIPAIDEYLDRHAIKFNQPRLNSLKTESYRFSKLGNCSGWNTFYELTSNNSGAKLTYKSFEGPNNADSGHVLLEKKTFKITRTEWNDFKLMIDTTCFWTMHIDQGNEAFWGGTTWRIQGFQPDGNNCANRKMHLVSGWHPDSSNFTNLCAKIVSFADKK